VKTKKAKATSSVGKTRSHSLVGLKNLTQKERRKEKRTLVLKRGDLCRHTQTGEKEDRAAVRSRSTSGVVVADAGVKEIVPPRRPLLSEGMRKRSTLWEDERAGRRRKASGKGQAMRCVDCFEKRGRHEQQPHTPGIPPTIYARKGN